MPRLLERPFLKLEQQHFERGYHFAAGELLSGHQSVSDLRAAAHNQESPVQAFVKGILKACDDFLVRTAPTSTEANTVERLVKAQREVSRQLRDASTWFPTAERPDWDGYFSFIAYAVSQRGSCPRRKVGAVFTDAHRDIVATGYNGRAAGLPECEGFNTSCPAVREKSGSGLLGCEAIHAEMNALARCKDIHKVDTIYLTCSPCTHCVSVLLSTSAKRIVFSELYADSDEPQRRWEGAGRAWLHYRGPECENVTA